VVVKPEVCLNAHRDQYRKVGLSNVISGLLPDHGQTGSYIEGQTTEIDLGGRR
jgi:hypothetical protein